MADGNGFIKVNDKLPEDGSIIDKDTICVCSGTFRASSAMDGRNAFVTARITFCACFLVLE